MMINHVDSKSLGNENDDDVYEGDNIDDDERNHQDDGNCAADFSLLNLPKGKSLGRSKPATSSYEQAPQHTVWDDFYYIQALLNCLL